MTVTNFQQTLQQLIERWIAPTLKSSGFSRHGQRFARDAGDCIQIVNIQRSVASSRQSVKFTVNLGIKSKAVRDFFSPRSSDSHTIGGCHWQARLHNIVPADIPEWVTIEPQTDIEELGHGLQMWIQVYALPTFAKFASDSSLTDLWMTGVGPGLTRFARLMNLAVLLHKANRQHDLASVLDQLDQVSQGKPIAARVEGLRDRLLPPSG